MAANLPDVFLLSVFSKLSANDRLNASQVCPNWYYRVREVNQNLKCLTITVDCQTLRKYVINEFIFGYSTPVKQQLMRDEEKTQKIEDREKIEFSTEWNTLFCSTSSGLQLSSITVQHIIDAFPATTELNFINRSENVAQYEFLVQMLENNQDNNSWGRQLTGLRLKDMCGGQELTPTFNFAVSQRLFNAINQLPSLKRLALDLKCENAGSLQLHDLSVLARLKEVRFEQSETEDLNFFLSCVELYAAENDDLRIDLPKGADVLYTQLRSLPKTDDTTSPIHDPNIRARIIRLDQSFLNPYLTYSQTRLRSVTTSFPNLTSFSVDCPSLADYAPMLKILSTQLLSLRHLVLCVDFKETKSRRQDGDNNEDGVDDFKNRFRITDPSPSTPLTLVTALELRTIITTHSDLQWLNLPLLVPNAKIIHFDYYCCQKCNIDSYQINMVEILPEQKALNQKCFGPILQQLDQSFTEISLEQITFAGRNAVNVSAKQLLE